MFALRASGGRCEISRGVQDAEDGMEDEGEKGIELLGVVRLEIFEEGFSCGCKVLLGVDFPLSL